MDFACIETWLALPEFRVTGQVMRSHNLELHLERRDTYLVCPRCQGSCARIKEGRQRCLRDLPILDRPVTLRLHLKRFQCADCHHRPWEQSETFGERVQWTERLSHQVRQEYLHGGPCAFPTKCVGNPCPGARAMNWRAAMASRHARYVAGHLKRAMVDAPASW